MKTMKRIASALLAVMMMFALSVGAFATASTGGTIQITGSASGHTFKAYQVLTGDITTDSTTKESTITNPKWGANANQTAGTAVDEATMTAFKAAASTPTNIWKDYVNQSSTPIAEGKVGTDGTLTLGGSLAAGYYLLVEEYTNASGSKTDDYLTTVSDGGTAEVEAKIGTVESYKKVKDINDSTETSKSDWQDSADHDIGDAVDFEFVGTLPENYSSFKTTYKYVFHDSQSNGLTFNSVTKVYALNGTTETEFATSDYTVVSSGLSDGCTFEVQFANLKTTSIASSITKDTKIVVEYTSTLNKNAVLGYAGNPNEMRLEYSDNTKDTSSTDYTAWDKVIVFTYAAVVNKQDENGQPLTGATFSLYKWNTSGTGSYYGTDEGSWDAESSKLTKSALDGVADCVFTWKGLDDGIYKIVEDSAPDGYNAIGDIIFEVSAGHVTDDVDPTLTSLGGTLPTGATGYTFTADTSAGTVTTTVEDKQGLILPVTGSIGTTIFYVVGGVLVVGAAVLLITKVRMRRHE